MATKVRHPVMDYLSIAIAVLGIAIAATALYVVSPVLMVVAAGLMILSLVIFFSSSAQRLVSHVPGVEALHHKFGS